MTNDGWISFKDQQPENEKTVWISNGESVWVEYQEEHIKSAPLTYYWQYANPPNPPNVKERIWKKISDGNPLNKGNYWVYIPEEKRNPDFYKEDGVYLGYFWLDNDKYKNGYWPGSSDKEGRPLFTHYMELIQFDEEPPKPPEQSMKRCCVYCRDYLCEESQSTKIDNEWCYCLNCYNEICAKPPQKEKHWCESKVSSKRSVCFEQENQLFFHRYSEETSVIDEINFCPICGFSLKDKDE